MDEDIDPYDVMEENFDDKYADEIEAMDDIEEDIDFVSFKHPTRLKSNDLDKMILTNENGISLKNDLKRGIESFSDDELKYSDNDSDGSLDMQPKKQKLDDKPTATKNDNITSRTSTARKLLEQLKSSENNNFEDINTFVQSKRVFTRPILGMDCVNVTSTCGDRVYLRLNSSHPDEEMDKICGWQKNSTEDGLNLLSMPFQSLLESVLSKRHDKEIERVNQLVNRDNSGNQHTADKPTELWVEKYQPRQYTELLSDDGTNRLLLRWLKLWDETVFNKKPVSKRQASKKFHQKKQFNSTLSKEKDKFQKKPFYNLEDDLVTDKKGRPKKKIALLCGNPGLGKTTLAHVISKHAGYNTVEMNASDDRSPELFLNRIEATTQMKAVMGVNKKPNCLVIDEIDGAPAPAIKILLDIVKATEGVPGKNKNKKKKSKKELILNRPIICICNDQYVPALRQLRQVAFILNFPPTVPSRLASRLLMISQIEELRIDIGSLLQLTDKTENDIRSCLNTLQFINEKQNEIKPEDIIKMEVGQKDFKKGIRPIIEAVFRLPRTNKRGKHAQRFTEGSGKTSASHRFYNMLHLVSGNTDGEKLSQGVFDHYLSVKNKDPYLESVLMATDWLEFFDFVQSKVQTTQDYVLYRYSPFLTVAFHMYFAQAANPKLTFTNISYENHMKLTHNQQTLELMLTGIEPSLRRFCTKKVCLSDIIPLLFFITMPALRPVNTQLYSEAEKQMLFNLISTMISYNLTYRQERAVEGHYTYLLEPNIEELITYTGLPQHRHLPYATKQLIAREVELERMRIAESVIKVTSHENQKKANAPTSKEIVDKQKLEPKLLEKCMQNDKPQLDFFGRIVKPSSFQEKYRQENNERKKKTQLIYTDVKFKFNEGYTNAVRRPVKIHEFF